MPVAKVRAVTEVVLNALDLKVMRRFYEDVLGFTFRNQWPETEPTIVFLAINDRGTELALGGHPDMLVLIDPARHPGTFGRFDTPARRQSTLNHLAFEIDDAEYDEAWRRLEERGIACTPDEFRWANARALFFEDPEGNMLELICHHAG